MIDTHAHLDALDDDPADVVARARDAGVTRILTVGTTPAGCRRALELAEQFEEVFAILGIHPHEAGTTTDADVAEVRELLAHPRAVAVGETGLDWFRDYAPPDASAAPLRARARRSPASSGSPSSSTPARPTPTRSPRSPTSPARVVLHCFSSPHLLEPALERGWYVSFAGNASFPKAVDLRLAATQVPADRILAETDCPYLAPQPVRGQRNEPAFVVHTVAALAQARGEDAAELGRRSS